MKKFSDNKADARETSDMLCEAFRENDIFLGGSSMGQGLRKAARYYIGHHMRQQPNPDHFNLEGASDLNEDLKCNPVENSFYVCDIGVVMSQFWQWRKHFPRVEPFYAVKCNPDPLIIKTLAILGTNFDCASRTEFRLVQDICKDLPRNPDIIYANPCKSRVHLIEAVCKGIRKVTFDNAAEIIKCAEISKKIQLVLRIITDDRGSQCRLSTKVRYSKLSSFFLYLPFINYKEPNEVLNFCAVVLFDCFSLGHHVKNGVPFLPLPRNMGLML